MTTRELTIDGVAWRVSLEPAGLRYVSELGYGCHVPLALTTLDGTPETFAELTDALLVAWARQAMQPRRRRRF